MLIFRDEIRSKELLDLSYKEKYMNKLTRMALAFALVAFTTVPAMAVDKNIITQLIGVGVGTPVSTVMGLLRGGVSKGVEYSGDISDELGGHGFGELIGVPVGMVSGFALGGVFGTVKGFVDGIDGGINDPLTADSMGLTGTFTDYDAYDINI